MQLLRRTREIQLLGDSNEAAKLAQFHSLALPVGHTGTTQEAWTVSEHERNCQGSDSQQPQHDANAPTQMYDTDYERQPKADHAS